MRRADGEHQDRSRGAKKRRARGGKASRARRLENFRQHKAAAPAAAPAIKWEQLAHGLLRQQRATLRDGARAAWVRMLRMCINVEYIAPILRGAINLQYIVNT